MAIAISTPARHYTLVVKQVYETYFKLLTVGEITKKTLNKLVPHYPLQR